MNEQDVKVPDPPAIYTAPACGFKIQQRKKTKRIRKELENNKII